ncbi:MAG: phytanoyl-CoA dioxygenase family protein [Akkermansiaceae bacterium]|jgi:ectoine hydroxylase-related dioxygenase (phytanoyl-CoA dioxygenase family)
MVMRPRDRRREFFQQEGSLVVKNFFSASEIAGAAKAQDAYYRGEYDREPEFDWPRPRKCRARARKHPYASFFSKALAKLLRDGRLAHLIQESCDMPNVRFWHDQLLYEEPREIGEINYHWHREESRWKTCAADQMITAWIPLVDFTPEMGPITLVPEGRDLETHRRMALHAGDLVLFGKSLLHGNPSNFGDQPRRALAAHFASGDLRYQACGKFSHVNERIVRRLDGLPDFQDERVCPLIIA